MESIHAYLLNRIKYMEFNEQGLPAQGTDGAMWRRQEPQKRVSEDQLAYWKRQLEGAPVALDLFTDHPRSPTPALNNSRLCFALPQRLSAALKTLSGQEGINLFTLLLAAFETLLYRYTGQDDLLIGTRGIVRAETELNDSDDTGYGAASLLALRARVDGTLPFRKLLGLVRSVVVEAYEHQDVAFEQVVEALRAEHDAGRHLLFQVMFVLDDETPPESEGHEFRPSSKWIEGMAGIDLTLVIESATRELRGWFEYNADLFEEATIARMAGHWQSLLEGIVEDPSLQLSALPLLTEEERRQVLVDWNDTAADYSIDTCIHQLFEAQVERTPDAIALVYEETELTYRELNRRANQLAHHLQQLGVKPETLVGLCLERSPEMIVGLLSILKAGGAYVPLDPTYPAERLAFMLTDAGVSVLLTQRHLPAGEFKDGVKVLYLDEY